MSRLNSIFAAILVAITMVACDRRDREDDQIVTPSQTGVPDAAATIDGTSPSTNTMPGSTAPDNTTPGEGMNQAPNSADAGGTPPMDGSSAMEGAATPGTPTAAGTSDADFYRRALGSGASEVSLSEHAARTSSSADVKRIADMLVTDHRDLNGKLRAASGMSEAAPPPAEAKAAEDIKSMTGTAFDTAYLRKMSDGHKKSIALYETAANSAGDSETRRLASAALPKLREHAGHVEKALTTASRNP